MSNPSQYCQKGYIIEAMQWTGENIHDLWAWAGTDKIYGPVPAEDDRLATPARLYVGTISMWVDIKIGEWILSDLFGFYLCEPDVFEDKYFEVKQ